MSDTTFPNPTRLEAHTSTQMNANNPGNIQFIDKSSNSQFWSDNALTDAESKVRELKKSEEKKVMVVRGHAWSAGSNRGNMKGSCHGETVKLLPSESTNEAEVEDKPPFRLLSEDAGARSLLQSMKNDSDRIRCLQTNQPKFTASMPPKPEGAKTRWLRGQVENLRRENEMLRFLADQNRLPPPAATLSSPSIGGADVQELVNEANALKRENEAIRIQLSHLIPTTTSLDDLPPPYTPKDLSWSL